VNERLAILLAGDYPADPTLGSSKVLYKLQEEFVALGHRCDLLLASDIGGVRVRQFRQLLAPWRAGQAIVRFLERQHYDVVDAASAEGLWFGVLKKFGAYRDCAYICRSNGLEPLNYRRMLDDAAEGLIRKPWTRRLWYPASRLSQVAAAGHLADRLLVLNEQDRAYAADHGWQPADRIAVVPHGVSERLLSNAPPANAPRGAGMLFCGSWDHVKGIHYLVETLRRLHASGTLAPLTVLGPGHPPATVLGAFPEELRPFVTVIPKIPEDGVMAEYRRHDLLLWTSTYEGFGLVLLEAMSQGLPVVTTPVGAASTLVRDGVNGLLVPARDAAATAAAAARLLGDPALRARLASEARETIKGMTWRATAERTLQVYRDARAERHAG
jgi:glycosyltransferase involved in cell wall biosynthesis